MATPLRMPDLGTVEGTVTLVRWLKAEGDTVTLGEPLFEVETDKGVSEVEAALAGVLVKKLVADGGRAGPGETIAMIRRPGEPAAEPARPSGVPVAPVVRALAEKHGVDLAAVKPTGPGGRITRQDVLAAARGGSTAARQAATQAAPAASAPPAAVATPSGSLTPRQAVVARKVSQSHREKPTYHVTAQVDMGKAHAARERARASAKAIRWDAFFVRACAIAIAEMPVFKSWLEADGIAVHPGVDIAVAVGVGDELAIPAVRSPAAKNLSVISADIDALARKAETGTLGPQDVVGSCFLVSNLGMFPVESFDAIIYPEHSAALAVGAITPTPVSDGTRIWIAGLARLTLSVDHRLINGRTAARFLARVREALENGEAE
ncbi:MAG TPA: dihydrolipoamide acetyltransferase family protein [bacterium]|nr:dihydrolipoamide acetyltransferase family protein [bacterium]